MTHEDAITMLRYFKKEDKIARLFPKETRERVKELNDICIEALEKQTPKKPITKVYDLGDKSENEVCCPKCDVMIGTIGDIRQGLIIETPYCWNCGQAIDWSE